MTALSLLVDRLFDGERFLHGRRLIAIEGDRITQLRPLSESDPLPPGARDFRGSTLAPGFIDAHAHIARAGQFEADEPPNPGAMVHNLKMALRGGVTTVGDMGSTAPMSRALRRAGAELSGVGPALRAAGPLLTDPAGYPLDWMKPLHRKLGVAIACDGERSARRAVQRVAEAGMDHVKLCIMHRSYALKPLGVFKRPVARAIVDEAHRLGLRALAHAHWSADYELALDAGVDALMHSSFDPLRPELVQRVRDSGVSVCPTLYVFHSACVAPEERWDLDPERRRRVVAAVSRSWTRFAEAYATSGDVVPPGIAGGLPKEAGREALRVAVANLKLLHDAGVPFAYGSDGPYGFSVIGRPLDELELFAASGLTNVECLRAATSQAASLLGTNDRGRIALGQRADLVILDGDAESELANVGRVRFVVQAGQLIDPRAPDIRAAARRARAVARGIAETLWEAARGSMKV